MRKRAEVLIWSVMLIFMVGYGIALATLWSEYGELTVGTIVGGDDFLVRDVSDTSLGGAGTQKRYAYSSMRGDVGLSVPRVLTIASGVHDGDNDAAVMSDSGETFTASQFVGMTLYNVTDVSSCTVTANDGTTITCTLAGGTDNNWDTNDVWQVGPGPTQSGDWFYVVAASTIRHPATVGYVVCYESDATAVLTVEMASDSMIFQGTLATTVVALDAGDAIDSSGSTTGDYICVHNKSATEAQGKGVRGTWADGGAS